MQQSGCRGVSPNHPLNACKSPKYEQEDVGGTLWLSSKKQPPWPRPAPPQYLLPGWAVPQGPPQHVPHSARVPAPAPTAAPRGAHPVLWGRVGRLGLVPTRGGRRERCRGLFSTPPGSPVDPELLWESVPSLPSPSRFSPANIPPSSAPASQICPRAVAAQQLTEHMGTTCPGSAPQHLPARSGTRWGASPCSPPFFWHPNPCFCRHRRLWPLMHSLLMLGEVSCTPSAQAMGKLRHRSNRSVPRHL